jgi:hypothetical protein
VQLLSFQVEKKMAKAEKKRKKGADKLDEFLRCNPIPVVLGPQGHPYLIDHHHLASALYRLGIENCYIGVAKDLSSLSEEDFWKEMARLQLVWQHNHAGEAVPLELMPKLLPPTVAGRGCIKFFSSV